MFPYLEPSDTIDSDHETIRHFVSQTTQDASRPAEKTTPAVNIELCDRFGLKPLAFDGRTDAIYHPFDLQGNRHMEYLSYRGEFQDVPIEQIRETFQRAYTLTTPASGADFARDVDRETPPRAN